MSLQIRCPNPKCKKQLKVSTTKLGRDVICPACGCAIDVVDPDSPTLTELPQGVTPDVHKSGPPDPLVGESISHYDILEKLGEGGMAAVYRARNRRLKKQIALKVLSGKVVESDPSLGRRFIREARAAANLEHPNIVPIHFIGSGSGYFFIEMQLVDGESLAERIHRKKKLSVEQAIRITIDAAGALQFAHEEGIVHRDIKPGNIMLMRDGCVKVMDFGLAKMSQARTQLTLDGHIMGTPRYMSPEQCQGRETDARSDIYSLGCTLFEMLTGQPPFVGENPLAIMSQHKDTPPPSPEKLVPDLPDWTCAVVLRMLSKDPNHRYQGCKEVVADLSRALEGDSIGPETERQFRQAVRQVHVTKRLYVLAMVVMLAVAGIGGAVWMLRGRGVLDGDERGTSGNCVQDSPSTIPGPERLDETPKAEPVVAAQSSAQERIAQPKPGKDTVKPEPAHEQAKAIEKLAVQPQARQDSRTPEVAPAATGTVAAPQVGEKREPVFTPKPEPEREVKLDPEQDESTFDVAKYAKVVAQINNLIDEYEYDKASALCRADPALEKPLRFRRKRVELLQLLQRKAVTSLGSSNTRVAMGEIAPRWGFAKKIMGADSQYVFAFDGKFKKAWTDFSKEEILRLYRRVLPDTIDEVPKRVALSVFLSEGTPNERLMELAQLELGTAAKDGVDLRAWTILLEGSRTLASHRATDRKTDSAAFFPINDHGKWGFIDGTGKIVIGPRFGSASRFAEGLAPVEVDGTWGYIDRTARMVIDPQFGAAWPFAEGVACVENYGKYGYIDKKGGYVIEPMYDWAGDFSEGLAPIKTRSPDGIAHGYIDKTGKVVISPQFKNAGKFSGGLAPVRGTDWDGFGYIDEECALVIAPRFASAGCFSEGLAPVQVGGKYGYIDRKGDFVIKPQFGDAGPFSGGLARVRAVGDSPGHGGKWSFVDKKGATAIPPRFDAAMDFSQGVAQVEIKGISAYVDRNGGVIWSNVVLHGYEAVDVTLVVDTTTSMRESLGRLHNSIDLCIALLRGIADAEIRVGVVAYRDRAGAVRIKTARRVDEFYHLKSVIPTSDLRHVSTFIQSMRVGPGPKTLKEAEDFAEGKGIPASEDVCGALNAAINFPRSRRRAIVLFADASPHSEDMETIRQLAASMRKQGDTLSIIFATPPIHVSGLFGNARKSAIEHQRKAVRDVVEAYKTIASAGGGGLVELKKDTQIPLAVAGLVFPDVKRDAIRASHDKLKKRSVRPPGAGQP